MRCMGSCHANAWCKSTKNGQLFPTIDSLPVDRFSLRCAWAELQTLTGSTIIGREGLHQCRSETLRLHLTPTPSRL